MLDASAPVPHMKIVPPPNNVVEKLNNGVADSGGSTVKVN
jgi:hypothetical protein